MRSGSLVYKINSMDNVTEVSQRDLILRYQKILIYQIRIQEHGDLELMDGSSS